MENERPWPAETIEMRPLAALKNYERNARTHSESQIRQIADSIKEWGFTVPILVDEAGEIIAGHGRAMAAALLELARVPVMVARGWTQKQIRAYRIADNQLALNAAWNVELLSAELGELEGLESLIGFSESELTALLRGEIDNRPLPTESEARHTLAQRFGVPPFSVLNAREGWWQERKRAWLALGIESELGRGDSAGALETSDTVKRLKPKAHGRRAAKAFAEDSLIERRDRIRAGEETASLKGGLTWATTTDPYRAEKRREKVAVVAGKGWAEGGPARRDANFYNAKRAWEKANGRRISTAEFRENHWKGYQS